MSAALQIFPIGIGSRDNAPTTFGRGRRSGRGQTLALVERLRLWRPTQSRCRDIRVRTAELVHHCHTLRLYVTAGAEFSPRSGCPLVHVETKEANCQTGSCISLRRPPPSTEKEHRRTSSTAPSRVSCREWIATSAMGLFSIYAAFATLLDPCDVIEASPTARSCTHTPFAHGLAACQYRARSSQSISLESESGPAHGTMTLAFSPHHKRAETNCHGQTRQGILARLQASKKHTHAALQFVMRHLRRSTRRSLQSRVMALWRTLLLPSLSLSRFSTWHTVASVARQLRVASRALDCFQPCAATGPATVWSERASAASPLIGRLESSRRVFSRVRSLLGLRPRNHTFCAVHFRFIRSWLRFAGRVFRCRMLPVRQQLRPASTVRDPHGRDLSRFCETTGFADAHGLGRYLPSPIPLIEDLRSKYRPAVPTVCGCWRERNRTGSLRGVALMETYHAGTTCHHVPPTCFTLHEDLLPACYSGTPNFGGKLV